MASFRRSGVFGIVGVVVVGVLCALVAVTMGQGQASPKGALTVIFGIVGAYLVVLFSLQLGDTSRAEGADAAASSVEPADPTALEEPTLWRAMAVRPVDADAEKARKALWRTTRGSIHTGMLVCALIFLSVPPIYLLDTFVPLMVGTPLIAGIALWKSVRLMTPGGDLDDAYDLASRAMAPLGLAVVERPTVGIEAKAVTPLRMGPALHGAVVLEGERHGRRVAVRMPADGAPGSEVGVAVDSPEFDLRARRGRLTVGRDGPPEVRATLRAMPSSPRWTGVRGGGGEGTISVRRKGTAANARGDWLVDLWLAERLAEAIEEAARGRSVVRSQ